MTHAPLLHAKVTPWAGTVTTHPLVSYLTHSLLGFVGAKEMCLQLK